MKKVIIVIIFFIVGISFVIFGPVIWKPVFVLSDIQKIFSIHSLVAQNILLRKNILDLKDEIYSIRKSFVFPSQNRTINAKVYSIYPFNTNQKLYLSSGYLDGIKVGKAVMFSKTSIIGKIVKVSKYNSEVITVFSHNFSVPVRIGKNEISGLFYGGVNPSVKLIDKTKKISIGDIVVSTTKDFPYGLVIGTISSVKNDSSGAFLQANINLPYTISDIRNVFVVK